MLGLFTLAAAGRFMRSAAEFFLESTLGRIILCAAVAFLWLHFYHDPKIRDQARSECEAAQLQKTLNEVERQRRASDAVIADAEKQQAVSDREMADLKKKKDDVDADLAKTRASCRLIPDEQRRKLRDIK